jgi:hypothetical protein
MDFSLKLVNNSLEKNLLLLKKINKSILIIKPYGDIYSDYLVLENFPNTLDFGDINALIPNESFLKIDNLMKSTIRGGNKNFYLTSYIKSTKKSEINNKIEEFIFFQELDNVKPKFLITLGKVVAKKMLKKSDIKYFSPLKFNFKENNILVIVIPHPKFYQNEDKLLRVSSKLKKIIEDINKDTETPQIQNKFSSLEIPISVDNLALF